MPIKLSDKRKAKKAVSTNSLFETLDLYEPGIVEKALRKKYPTVEKIRDIIEKPKRKYFFDSLLEKRKR